MCSMTTSSRTFYLMCSMTTSSSTSSFPSLMSSMSCKSKKPRKVRQKKKKKIGGGSCPPGKCLVFGGGKCPNLGVVNVRILGEVNVLLANDSQSCKLSSHLCSTLSFYSCSLSVNLIIFISKLPNLRCDHIKLHDIYHQKHQLRLKMNILFNCLFKRQLTVTVVFISHLLFGVIRYNLYSTVAIIIMNT